MAAFDPQRLFARERDRLRLRHPGDRDPVDPFDFVVDEGQLSLPLHVIEHRHATVADDDELLLFVRMQPAHEDVAPDAAAKRQRRDCDVGNPLFEIAAPLSGDGGRPLAKQVNHGRDVVGREAPQDVLFRPKPTQVQAVRVDVVELPQRPFIN